MGATAIKGISAKVREGKVCELDHTYVLNLHDSNFYNLPWAQLHLDMQQWKGNKGKLLNLLWLLPAVGKAPAGPRLKRPSTHLLQARLLKAPPT